MEPCGRFPTPECENSPVLGQHSSRRGEAPFLPSLFERDSAFSDVTDPLRFGRSKSKFLSVTFGEPDWPTRLGLCGLAATNPAPAQPPTAREARKRWAALIKQVYESSPRRLDHRLPVREIRV